MQVRERERGEGERKLTCVVNRALGFFFFLGVLEREKVDEGRERREKSLKCVSVNIFLFLAFNSIIIKKNKKKQI